MIARRTSKTAQNELDRYLRIVGLLDHLDPCREMSIRELTEEFNKFSARYQMTESALQRILTYESKFRVIAKYVMEKLKRKEDKEIV